MRHGRSLGWWRLDEQHSMHDAAHAPSIGRERDCERDTAGRVVRSLPQGHATLSGAFLLLGRLALVFDQQLQCMAAELGWIARQRRQKRYLAILPAWIAGLGLDRGLLALSIGQEAAKEPAQKHTYSLMSTHDGGTGA